jgi:hypothetical protein
MRTELNARVRSQTKLISIHLISAAVVVKSTRRLRVMRERGHIQIGYPSPHLSEYFAEYVSLQILMLFCIASPLVFALWLLRGGSRPTVASHWRVVEAQLL